MPAAGYLASPALLHAAIQGEGERQDVCVCMEGRKQGGGMGGGREDGERIFKGREKLSGENKLRKAIAARERLGEIKGLHILGTQSRLRIHVQSCVESGLRIQIENPDSIHIESRLRIYVQEASERSLQIGVVF